VVINFGVTIYHFFPLKIQIAATLKFEIWVGPAGFHLVTRSGSERVSAVC